MNRSTVLVCACLALGCHAAPPATPAGSIGEQTLSHMHDRYASKWYHTVTFRQRTTISLPTGEQRTEQWYESLAQLDGRTVLRIDVGSPRDGNGILYTADSSWVIRGGTVASQRPNGNEFLPLIEGVYVQPVTQTAAELRREGFDLAKGYHRTWNGMRVAVVGASSEADSTSQQFWVDRDRELLVRMYIALAPARTFDVHLEKYERAGDGWLATHVELLSGGRAVQTEDYSDWRAEVALAPALFDVKQWNAAAHWAKDGADH